MKIAALFVGVILSCAVTAAGQSVPKSDTQSWNDVQVTVSLETLVDGRAEGLRRNRRGGFGQIRHERHDRSPLQGLPHTGSLSNSSLTWTLFFVFLDLLTQRAERQITADNMSVH